MYIDYEKDNSLADDVFTVMLRAMEEDNGAAAAVLGCLWAALHGSYTREVAEAIRPVMARHDEGWPLLIREVH
jgi:hypothetical protein